MNLRHFIGQTQKTPVEEDEIVADDRSEATYYFMKNSVIEKKFDDDDSIDQKRELQRIPTCAVFHKIASGKGVPHTFVGQCSYDCWLRCLNLMYLTGFIRQWPSLPRVVVNIHISDCGDLSKSSNRSSCPSASCHMRVCLQRSDMLFRKCAQSKVCCNHKYTRLSPLRVVSQGFYGVTYYIGFRDKFDVQVSELASCFDLSLNLSLTDRRPHREDL